VSGIDCAQLQSVAIPRWSFPTIKAERGLFSQAPDGTINNTNPPTPSTNQATTPPQRPLTGLWVTPMRHFPRDLLSRLWAAQTATADLSAASLPSLR